MQFQIVNFEPTLDSILNSDCIILPIYQGKQQPFITTEFNNSCDNLISELLDSQDLTGKFGETKWLFTKNTRVLTVGFGEEGSLTNNGYIRLLRVSLSQLTSRNFNTVTNCLADVEFNQEYKSLDAPKPQTLDWKLKQIILLTQRFHNPPIRYQQSEPDCVNIENYFIATCSDLTILQEPVQKLVQESLALSNGIKSAMDLANCPPNICNPAYFAEKSLDLANSHSKLSCKAFSHEQLEEMGMGAFCSVSQGSNHPGKLIILEYNGSSNKSDQPYVLIGKGITFDTGGYTLKPPKSMLGMKYDMCGAASVFGTMQTIAELNLPINVIGMLACAENMIGHKSTRPNDIVTSYKGLTIEINNTDAEGRLVLCDAISYAEKFNPKVIIDIATLTGAAMVALGYQYSAVYTNKKELENSLYKASIKTHDPIWSMPLCHDYDQLLKSPIADLHNSSPKPIAGSITAACFLANFVPKNCSWAHLDIAGSATKESDHVEATGRPVSLLVNYLQDAAK